jgi:hypothetical protein
MKKHIKSGFAPLDKKLATTGHLVNQQFSLIEAPNK